MRLTLPIACLLLGIAFPAMADLTVAASRVVHQAGSSSTPVRIRNTGDAPVLIQSWVDGGEVDAQPAQLRTPLVATPPLFRLNPGGRRDIYVRAAEPAGLPQDRESLLWLNILDVPARKADEAAVVEQAVRWRLKLFHRPEGLPGKPDAAIKSLQWTITRSEDGGMELRARNPSAYHVSLRTLAVGKRELAVSTADAVIPPYGEWKHLLDAGQLPLPPQPTLQITWIDGEGRHHPWSAQAAVALGMLDQP